MIRADIFAVILYAIGTVVGFFGIHYKIKNHPAVLPCLLVEVLISYVLFLCSLLHLCVNESMTVVYFVLFVAFAYFAKREIQEAR